jgi:1-acyl-sn-glycerol-3-phosphate acyltransferase
MSKGLLSLILWPLWFTFFAVTMILFFILFIIVPQKYLNYFIRPISWTYCLLAGQWLCKENGPPSPDGQPYLYMFNHESMFDQFMVAAFIPHYVTAVGAIEQFRYPIWGYIMRTYGVIPIIRQNVKKAINSLSKAEEALNNGVSFLISPEGTRTLTGELNSFKKGPFHLAKNTGTTIIPVGIIGAYKAKQKNDWRLTPGKLITRFGQPIKQKEFENLSVEEIRDLVFDRIQHLIKPEGSS